MKQQTDIRELDSSISQLFPVVKQLLEISRCAQKQLYSFDDLTVRYSARVSRIKRVAASIGLLKGSIGRASRVHVDDLPKLDEAMRKSFEAPSGPGEN